MSRHLGSVPKATEAKHRESRLFVLVRDAERSIIRDALVFRGDMAGAAEFLGVPVAYLKFRAKSLGGIVEKYPRREPWRPLRSSPASVAAAANARAARKAKADARKTADASPEDGDPSAGNRHSDQDRSADASVGVPDGVHAEETEFDADGDLTELGAHSEHDEQDHSDGVLCEE